MMNLFDLMGNSFLGSTPCLCDKTGVAICPIHEKNYENGIEAWKKHYIDMGLVSGFTMDGECEDITNKRALPELEGE